jgi:hypothetical protein
MSDSYITNENTGELNKVSGETKPEWCVFCYNDGEDITLIDRLSPIFLLDEEGKICENVMEDVVELIRDIVSGGDGHGTDETIVIRKVDVVS